jgi:outer membrane protein OmpA-like peptidoglycan-associated protein
MSNSILDSVMSLLGPQVSNALASQMGESSDTVQRGLQGGAVAMLASLVTKAEEPGMIGQLFGMVTNPQTSSALADVISHPAAAITGAGAASPLMDLGSKFLSLVFGSRMGVMADAVGQYSGLGTGKATTLLGMAAPLVLGGLSKFVSGNYASPASLMDALRNEAPRMQGLLPVGFRSLLGGAPAAVTALPPQTTAMTSRWLVPVVLLAGVLLAGLWFFNRHTDTAPKMTQTAAEPASASVMTALGNFSMVKLPGGVELNLPEFGVENKLLAFIKDDSKPVDSTTWFNFDRLTFDTGKATLQKSSEEQLNNIAEILKAYPNVHLKLGGYTDNTGDATANMALSAARAKSVLGSLVDKGIDAERLAAEGYGDQFPMGDNATEEGRQANRRTALRVTQK